MRTRTSAHLPWFGVCGCADLPVRIGLAADWECGRGRPRTSHGSASAGARTSRSALGLRQTGNADGDVRAPPMVRRLRVRGPPGPQWHCARLGMRTGTSAHLPGFGVCGCADLPVRIGLAADRECGRGRPRTSHGSASAGARTSRSAMGFAGPECGRGRPRTSQGSASAGARTSRSAWACATGMRTRTSAHLPWFGVCGCADLPVRIGAADWECGRGRPRTAHDGVCRGPRGPHWHCTGPGMRTRTSAHLPGFGVWGVRGPPGPHWALNADGDVPPWFATVPWVAGSECVLDACNEGSRAVGSGAERAVGYDGRFVGRVADEELHEHRVAETPGQG